MGGKNIFCALKSIVPERPTKLGDQKYRCTETPRANWAQKYRCTGTPRTRMGGKVHGTRTPRPGVGGTVQEMKGRLGDGDRQCADSTEEEGRGMERTRPQRRGERMERTDARTKPLGRGAHAPARAETIIL